MPLLAHRLKWGKQYLMVKKNCYQIDQASTSLRFILIKRCRA